MTTLTHNYPSYFMPSKMPYNKFNIHDTRFLFNMCNIYGFSSENNMYWASVTKHSDNNENTITITFNISIQPCKTTKLNISDIHITNIQANYNCTNYYSKLKLAQLKLMSEAFYTWIINELTENINIINSGVK